MNIFEDLVDELKEENLLEETVTETYKNESVTTEEEVSAENNFAEPLEASGDLAEENPASEEQIFVPSAPPANQAEYYRKRAMEEVTGLQMVEHIFSGAERQEKKILPKIYDDLNVKKALHAFMQVSGNMDAPEHAQAEFQLMQETEAWYSALSHRDKQISIAHLRRYCETTKPVLSSQALIALARFYRNSPYSEAVRSKFDLIITRLFTRDAGGAKREILFQRDDLMRHLSELYADWESVSVYSAAEDSEDGESAALLDAFKFEDFMNEAENAGSFDELVKNDFFNRLRTFKQNTNEQFFAPLVSATAVECNVRIGNRYVDLLEIEKGKGEIEKLENKYGFLHDQVISDATSKTLQLVELLRRKEEEPETGAQEDDEAFEDKNASAAKAESSSAENLPMLSGAFESGQYAVNKWLLVSSVIIILLSIGIYFWSNGQGSQAETLSQNVQVVPLDNSALNEFIRDARVGNRTFFAIVKPSWGVLNRDKKEEVLNKITGAGKEKGYSRVHLLNQNGKTAATVMDGEIEINN